MMAVRTYMQVLWRKKRRREPIYYNNLADYDDNVKRRYRMTAASCLPLDDPPAQTAVA